MLGPTREEARQIVASEFPQASSSQVEGVIEGCTVADPVEKKKYVNARRLFNTLRDMQELRGMRPN